MGCCKRGYSRGAAWQARLRGKCKEGWDTEQVRWEGGNCKEAATVAGQGIRDAVVGWYLPVQVVEEEVQGGGGGADGEGGSGQDL